MLPRIVRKAEPSAGLAERPFHRVHSLAYVTFPLRYHCPIVGDIAPILAIQLDVLQRLRALFPVAVEGERAPADFPGERAAFVVTVEQVTGGELQLAFSEAELDGATRWLARRSTDRLILECDPTVTAGLVAALRALPE